MTSLPDTTKTTLRRVSDLPSIFYRSDYLSEDAERRLLHEILSSRGTWTQLSGRRLQSLGGLVHAKGLIQTKLPSWLAPLVRQLDIDSNGVFGDKPANHVLINSYRPCEGILPHQDGPAYHPGVCIVSLGAPAVIRFRRKSDPPANTLPEVSLLLMPRSLLVFTDQAYTDCLHGIDEVHEEVLDGSVINLACHPELHHGDKVLRAKERISLTVRRVRTVLPNFVKLK